MPSQPTSPRLRVALLAVALAAACTSRPTPSERVEGPADPLAVMTRLASPEPTWVQALDPDEGALTREAHGWRVHARRGRPAPLDARFADRGDGLVEVRDRATDTTPWLSLRPEGAASVPAESRGGVVLARDVWPATDLAWSARGHRVELFLLLRDASAPGEFAWSLPDAAALRDAREMPDGSILASDVDGLPRLLIPQATARDARGERRVAQLTLREGRLRVRLDTRGMQFPVLLDPAFEIPLWRNPPLTVRPPVTTDPSFAWVGTRGVGVLWTGSGSSGAQLWEWDGERWTRPFIDSAFPAARNGGLTWDSTRDEVLLYGGSVGTERRGDLWRYNGVTWSEVTWTGAGPEARAGMAVAYDPSRRVLMVTGGVFYDQALAPPTDVRSDHWEFSASTSTWTRRLLHGATESFRARWRHRMAWDSRRAVMVLLGGCDQPGGTWYRDIYEYDPVANRWVERVPQSERPDFEGEFAAAYDPYRGRLVAYGGGRSTVWEWDGTQWLSHLAAGSPGPVRGNAAAFDLVRRRFLTYGDAGGSNELHEFASRGTACGDASDCLTGACTDGVCCNTDRCGACARCDGGGFSTSGVCSPVRSADDDTCTGPRTCNAEAACVARPCGSSSQCGPGGNCVDGVCCDRACDGACEACTAAKKGSGLDGACGPIAPDQDPDRECAAGTGFSAVCVPGVCDGASRCRINVGTPCAPARCIDAVTAQRPAACAADGSCTPLTRSCTPYRCNDGDCLVTCDNDSECAPGSGCLRGRCAPLTPDGGACEAPNRCLSGHCVDGVCCDRACDGACEACTAGRRGAGVDGTCGPVAADTDPDGDCADPQGVDAPCATGVCNGQGACRVNDGIACAPASCVNPTVARAAGVCAGGLCRAGAVQRCDPGICAAGECLASCDRDEQCTDLAFCLMGRCVPRLADGAMCAASTACQSGHCVDGVCCNRACDGTCEACTALQKGGGSDGFCGAVASGADPDGECPDASGDDAVCQPGVCDGLGACMMRPSSPCGTPSCVGDTSRRVAGSCGSNGRCVPGPVGSCGGFACREGQCLRRCALDVDCGPGVRCLDGACEVPRALGASCVTDRACASGHCADGVCCDRACNGACEACSAARRGEGADGACGGVRRGLDPDNECPAGVDGLCQPGVCDGAGACQINAGTICASPRCHDAQTAVAAARCQADGRCEAPARRSCDGYICRDGACLQRCVADGDCGAGMRCEFGGCVSPPPDAGVVTDVPAEPIPDHVEPIPDVISDVVNDLVVPVAPDVVTVDVPAAPDAPQPPPDRFTGGPACGCQHPGAGARGGLASLLASLIAVLHRRRRVR